MITKMMIVTMIFMMVIMIKAVLVRMNNIDWVFFFGRSLSNARQMSYTIYKGGSICKVDMVNYVNFRENPNSMSNVKCTTKVTCESSK